jgi:hypothetical protein
VGLFLPLDDALLRRASATVLPAETADEQIATRVSSTKITVSGTQQAFLGRDPVDVEGGVSNLKEGVEQHASDIITNV